MQLESRKNKVESIRKIAPITKKLGYLFKKQSFILLPSTTYLLYWDIIYKKLAF